MSIEFAAAVEEVVRGLLHERAELEHSIGAAMARVDAIDTMVLGFRAVTGPDGPCHDPAAFAPAGSEAGAVRVPACRDADAAGSLR